MKMISAAYSQLSAPIELPDDKLVQAQHGDADRHDHGAWAKDPSDSLPKSATAAMAPDPVTRRARYVPRAAYANRPNADLDAQEQIVYI